MLDNLTEPTEWKNEFGDWRITRFPTPICYKCSTATVIGVQGSTPVVEAKNMEYDPRQFMAVCPTCGYTLYKVVS